MRQSFFSVLCRDIRMALLAVVNGRSEVSDAFFGMRIVLCLLGRLSMLERGFGMRYEHIRMALFTMIDGFFRMADCLRQMILAVKLSLTKGHARLIIGVCWLGRALRCRLSE